MSSPNEATLLRDALGVLRERLPSGWAVEHIAGQGAGTGPGDALFDFRIKTGMAASGLAIVEARPGFTAADVERLFGPGLMRRLRELAGDKTILVVSDFLSPKARAKLTEEGISYLDLTGNVRLVMRSPGLYIETMGAQRRPGRARSTASVTASGTNFWRVARALVQVDPPYGVKDLQRATGVSTGWVSRVLDRLADEDLIERRPRGPVESVNWQELLRLRARSVDLLSTNTTRTYVSRGGAREVLEGVPPELARQLVVTGSFAAVRIAPVAAPALLVAYLVPAGGSPRYEDMAVPLGLLPADEGFDVALLRPPSPGPVEEARPDGDLLFVNLPQLVVDCLSGPGRMPAEGEAVLRWMEAHREEWCHPSLDAYLDATGGRA